MYVALVQTTRGDGHPDDMSAARLAVAQASTALALDGFAPGTSGNVSVRVADRVAVTPTGAQLALLKPDQITVVDLDGAVVGDGLAPTSELALHLGVYRARDAGAVVHTHSRFATALGCVIDELPCVHYALVELGGNIRVAPYRTFGSDELAAVTIDALRDRAAALMSNHGALVFGEDIAQAVSFARLLEWVCEIYWRASSIGPPRLLDESQREAAGRRFGAYGAIRQVAAAGEKS